MKINQPSKSQRRGRGRPREFDRNDVLVKAAKLFWRHGFEATSISMLTEEMRITPQSLYATFRSKAELYRESLNWYEANEAVVIWRTLEAEPCVVTAFSNVLEVCSGLFTQEGRPPGCMLSVALSSVGHEAAPLATELKKRRQAIVVRFCERIKAAMREGELAATTDAESLARFIFATIQGLSVQASDGITTTELDDAAQFVVRALERCYAQSDNLDDKDL